MHHTREGCHGGGPQDRYWPRPAMHVAPGHRMGLDQGSHPGMEGGGGGGGGGEAMRKGGREGGSKGGEEGEKEGRRKEGRRGREGRRGGGREGGRERGEEGEKEGRREEGGKKGERGRRVKGEGGGTQHNISVDHKAYVHVLVLCHDSGEKETYQHQHTSPLLFDPLVHVSHGQHFLLKLV